MNRREFIMNMGAAVSVASLGSGCSREAIANEASTTNNADAMLADVESAIRVELAR